MEIKDLIGDRHFMVGFMTNHENQIGMGKTILTVKSVEALKNTVKRQIANEYNVPAEAIHVVSAIELTREEFTRYLISSDEMNHPD